MNKVSWFELPADDAARASDFYSKVFGWSLSDMGGGSMMAVTTPSDDEGNPKDPGAINGDIAPRSAALTGPMIVITVDDLDEKIESIQAAGGKIVEPRKDYPEMGMAWAIAHDTEGNNIGVMQNI